MVETIDNNEVKLVDRINSILEYSSFSKMAVGYFYLSGFEAIKDKLSQVKNLKILIDNTTSQETVEELAKGFTKLDLASNYKKKEQDKITSNQKSKILDDSKASLSSQIENIEQSNVKIEALKTLSDFIKNKRIEIKVYTKGKLHSKAYLFEDERANKTDNKIIIGSSNLSISGLHHNSEMNVLIHGEENYKNLEKWFDKLWDEAEPFDEAIMDVLENSWLQYEITPYEMYLKTLYELTKDRIELDFDESIIDDMHFTHLYDFQKKAYKRAIKILDKYNGVFVSDVVGLGKSYIASAIVKHYREVKHKRAIMICPKPQVDMWQKYNDKFDLGLKIIPTSKLNFPKSKDGGTKEDYTLLDREDLEHYELVLFDESHAFRNPETQKYKMVAPFLQNKKVVLITATPQNKSIYDIYHQIKLFNPSDKISAPIYPSSLKQFFKQCEDNPKAVSELLTHILIRRKRKDILNSSEENLVFPKRKLETINYSMDKNFSNNKSYEKIRFIIGDKSLSTFKGLDRLKYTRYSLGSYLKDGAKSYPKYAQLSSVGKQLSGLMKILLFKRFESSVKSFYVTVSDMIERHERFVELIEKENIIAVGDKSNQILLKYSEEDIFGNEVLERLAELNVRYNADDFNIEELIKDTKDDILLLKELKKIPQEIIDNPNLDDKLQQLIKTIDKNKSKQILIFSEFTETVKYLKENVSTKFLNLVVEDAHGRRHNNTDLVYRFSPKSNMQEKLIDVSEKIDILIATDVLSEGQNLQDCSVVINYDIHWNPVRLIQRIGRVDRIGSEAEFIEVYNFLPELEIEKTLSLKERVHNRLQEIQDIIGLDEKVFTDDETVSDVTYDIDKKGVSGIYDGDDSILDDDDDTFDFGIDKAEKIILEIKKTDKELYEHIKNIPLGARCSKHSKDKGLYAFYKSKDLNGLYYMNDKKQIEKDINKILKIIKCEKDEKRQELSSEHNEYLKRLGRDFEREIALLEKEHREVDNLTPTQSYIQKALIAHLKNTQDEKSRQEIEVLDMIYTADLPHFVLGHINYIRREKLKGEKLIFALKKAYSHFDLENIYDKAKQNQSKEKIKMKLICSESLV